LAGAGGVLAGGGADLGGGGEVGFDAGTLGALGEVDDRAFDAVVAGLGELAGDGMGGGRAGGDVVVV